MQRKLTLRASWAKESGLPIELADVKPLIGRQIEETVLTGMKDCWHSAKTCYNRASLPGISDEVTGRPGLLFKNRQPIGVGAVVLGALAWVGRGAWGG